MLYLAFFLAGLVTGAAGICLVMLLLVHLDEMCDSEPEDWHLPPSRWPGRDGRP